MLQDYKDFIGPKTDYWRKAKQYEYQDIDRIVLALKNINHFTTRNTMTLRILGLVQNLGNNNLEITAAGHKLLVVSDKQSIIDEQLLKIYLDSPINTGINIPIFPMQVIYKTLSKTTHINFKEYQLFVCWVDNFDEITKVVQLIERYRNSSDAERNEIEKIIERKMVEMGIQDMKDNIIRLFNMFTLSSFITSDGVRFERALYRNSSTDTYSKLAQIIAESEFDDYIIFDYNYHHLINFYADHEDITESLRSLTKQERSIVVRTLQEKKELPDIDKIDPVIVTPTIVEAIKKPPRDSKNKTPFKLDYAAKESTNRIVGLFAERIVMKYEYDQLVKGGKVELTSQLKQVSLEDDSLGYDIQSFDAETSNEKHIEVKAVSGYPITFSFFISANEMAKAKEDPEYCVYIVFDYRSANPKIWPMPNIFLESNPEIIVSPAQYRVTVSVEH